MLVSTDNKSDKSLALLSQNFIKLFLCSAVSGLTFYGSCVNIMSIFLYLMNIYFLVQVDLILLDNAAKELPGDTEDQTTFRSN